VEFELSGCVSEESGDPASELRDDASLPESGDDESGVRDAEDASFDESERPASTVPDGDAEDDVESHPVIANAVRMEQAKRFRIAMIPRNPSTTRRSPRESRENTSSMETPSYLVPV
jgi:hypothetical protein